LPFSYSTFGYFCCSVTLPLVTFDIQFFSGSVISRSVILPFVIRRSVAQSYFLIHTSKNCCIPWPVFCSRGNTVTFSEYWSIVKSASKTQQCSIIILFFCEDMQAHSKMLCYSFEKFNCLPGLFCSEICIQPSPIRIWLSVQKYTWVPWLFSNSTGNCNWLPRFSFIYEENITLIPWLFSYSLRINSKQTQLGSMMIPRFTGETQLGNVTAL
jgi:hypothetical protein